ncbi:hypothetical protein F5Y16DRAFT_385472 [Xylariaceae sp. FL0255]|nr:hypothetical protein F5Y16DRAFT_385472 [Xylariaceae sp. FL0255]
MSLPQLWTLNGVLMVVIRSMRANTALLMAITACLLGVCYKFQYLKRHNDSERQKVTDTAEDCSHVGFHVL